MTMPEGLFFRTKTGPEAEEAFMAAEYFCRCPNWSGTWDLDIEAGNLGLTHRACAQAPGGEWRESVYLMDLPVSLTETPESWLNPATGKTQHYTTLMLDPTLPVGPETYCRCGSTDGTWILGADPGGEIILTHRACGSPPRGDHWREAVATVASLQVTLTVERCSSDGGWHGVSHRCDCGVDFRIEKIFNQEPCRCGTDARGPWSFSVDCGTPQLFHHACGRELYGQPEWFRSTTLSEVLVTLRTGACGEKGFTIHPGNAASVWNTHYCTCGNPDPVWVLSTAIETPIVLTHRACREQTDWNDLHIEFTINVTGEFTTTGDETTLHLVPVKEQP